MPSSEAVNQLCSELCATTTPHHITVSAVEELTLTSVGEDGAGLTPAVFVVSLNYAVVTLSCRHISHQPHHPLVNIQIDK